jgi:hypothetical protein
MQAGAEVNLGFLPEGPNVADGHVQAARQAMETAWVGQEILDE